MPLGIISGFVRTAGHAPVPNVDVILANIRTVEGGPIPVTALTPRVGRPPYGIADTTRGSGAYCILFDWPGTHIGAMANQVQVQLLVLDPARLAPMIGSAHPSGCTWTADVRSIMSAFLPSADLPGILNAIADGRRALPHSSRLLRGMLSDPLSTDVRSAVIRGDVTVRS